MTSKRFSVDSRNSYDFDTFRTEDREAEVRRLDARASTNIEQFVRNLEVAGFRNGSTFLDIGSGTGRRAIEVATRFPNSLVTGIDTSSELLKFATERAESLELSNVKFLYQDVNAHTLEKGKFDFVYGRLVIQHMLAPEKTVGTILGLVKLGGTIYLEDTDREWMDIYPAPATWVEAYRMVKEIQKIRGGDPTSGRKLASYLYNCGAGDIQTALYPVTGTQETVRDWLENYAPTFFTNMPPEDQAKCLSALEDIRRMNEKEFISFYQVWFHAYGKRKG